jgi:hypothetical protein
MIFRPAGRFLTGPLPPLVFFARFFAAVIRPPLLIFAIGYFPWDDLFFRFAALTEQEL